MFRRNPRTANPYLGYKTATVAVAPEVKVTLEPDSQTVETVVVTGMTKRINDCLPGASDQLVADDEIMGLADISRGLEGLFGRCLGERIRYFVAPLPRSASAVRRRFTAARSRFGRRRRHYGDVADISAEDLSGDATTLIGSAIAGLNAEDIESFNILKDGSPPRSTVRALWPA